MADKRIDQLVAATTVGDDDLLVLQQNNQAKKLSGKKLGDYVYAAAAGKVAEVEQAVAEAQAAVDSLEEQKDTIAEAVASMAQLGTDTTLTTPGMAADAEATGNKINGAEIAALGSFEQTEITGAAIATFDDGADDIPVKALEIAIEPQQDLHGYDNPWPAGGGKNLFKNNATSGSLNGVTFTVNSDGTVTSGGTASSAVSFLLGTVTLPEGNYVASGGINGNAMINVVGKVNATTVDAQFTVASGGETITVNIYIANGSSANGVFKPMIRPAAITDATYAPYENICPITGWAGANIEKTGNNLWDEEWENVSTYIRSKNLIPVKPNTTYKFVTPTDPANGFRYYDINRQLIRTVYTLPNRIFTTPANCYFVWFALGSSYGATYNHDVSINYPVTDTTYHPYNPESTTYSLAFPSAAGTVYGAKLINEGTETWKLRVDMIRVDLGTLTWSLYNSTDVRQAWKADITPPFKIPAIREPMNAICDRSKAVPYSASWQPNNFSSASNQSTVVFCVEPGTYPDANSFKTAMSGVPLVYELANPVEYTITGKVVRTLLGLNNIWADTGNILDLIYRKQPISVSDIQENIDAVRDIIADREDSGIASKNYSIGALILIGNNLYEAVGPIATGESIVPGSNCTATTVSEQIAYIKSVINSLGNLAYLSYENA